MKIFFSIILLVMMSPSVFANNSCSNFLNADKSVKGVQNFFNKYIRDGNKPYEKRHVGINYGGTTTGADTSIAITIVRVARLTGKSVKEVQSIFKKYIQHGHGALTDEQIGRMGRGTHTPAATSLAIAIVEVAILKDMLPKEVQSFFRKHIQHGHKALRDEQIGRITWGTGTSAATSLAISIVRIAILADMPPKEVQSIFKKYILHRNGVALTDEQIGEITWGINTPAATSLAIAIVEVAILKDMPPKEVQSIFKKYILHRNGVALTDEQIGRITWGTHTPAETSILITIVQTAALLMNQIEN